MQVNTRSNDSGVMDSMAVNIEGNDQENSFVVPHLEVFLGKTLFGLIKTLGPPFGHVNILGSSALLFYYQGQSFACEFLGGRCSSVYNTTKECSVKRIRPNRPTRVFVRRSVGNQPSQLLGLMADVSAEDMRITLLDDSPEFWEDEKIYCCTSIGTQHQVRAHIGLYGTVKEWLPASKRLEVNFDMPFQTQSHQTLKDYINAKLAQSLFAGTDSEAESEDWCNLDSQPDFPEEIPVIKSDLCLICPTGLCGHSYNILTDPGDGSQSLLDHNAVP
ncbi:MAG TPA: hypothetical protein VIH45_02890 [Desulfuromonadaceae bacterium]